MSTPALDLDALRAALNDYTRREWRLDEQSDYDDAGPAGTYVSGAIVAPSTADEVAGGADEIHELGSLYPRAAAHLAVEAVNALSALLDIAEAATRLRRITGGAEALSHRLQDLITVIDNRTAGTDNHPTEVVHHMPYTNPGVTTCCGRPPFELMLSERMTGDPSAVTCVGRLT